MMIEEKREVSSSVEPKTFFTHAKRRSRYEDWKGSSDFQRFERSKSQPKFWRTRSGGSWKRSPSRNRSYSHKGNTYDRSRSNKRDIVGRSQSKSRIEVLEDDIKTLKSKQKKLEDTINELKNNSTNVKFCGIEEKEDVIIDKDIRVHFTEDSKDPTVIIDSGCPLDLIGNSLFEEYLKTNKLSKDKLQRQSCEQNFRFGPSEKYKSIEKYTIPINMKEKGRDTCFRTFVNTFVLKFLY